jgi:hypothetical protein
MKTDKLPTRREAVRKNIAEFSKLSPSQKISVLEKQRKTIAYLKTLRETKTEG